MEGGLECRTDEISERERDCNVSRRKERVRKVNVKVNNLE